MALTRVTNRGTDFSSGDHNIGIGTDNPTALLHVTGNVSVGGTLTYEDVTNVDSVGLATFQNGIHVTGGKVGIGTTNPRSGLEVQGTDGARITRALTGGNFSGYKFQINNPSGNSFSLNVGRVFNDVVATSLFNITQNGDIVPAASGSIDLGSSSITWDNIYGGTLYTDDKIVHRGDTNTSIRFPAADTFTVETAGTERVRVSAGGTVGIGTSNFAYAHSSVDDVVIGHSSNARAGVTLVSSPTTGSSCIAFSQGTSGTDQLHGKIDYNNSAGRLAFYANMSERFAVDSDGRILLNFNGGNSEINSAKMQVVGGNDANNIAIINSAASDEEGARSGNLFFRGRQSGNEKSTLAAVMASHDGTADDQKGVLIFKTNDGSDGDSPTERLRIDSDGDLTSTGPDNSFATIKYASNFTKLDLRGNGIGDSKSYLIGYGAGHASADNFHMVNGNTNGSLVFRTGSSTTERVHITSTGNVGIGSTTPTAKLYVNGTVNVSGIATFNDHIIATSKFTIGNVASIAGGAPIDKGVIGVYGTGRDMLTIQTNDNTEDRGISFRNNGDKYAGIIAMTDRGSNTADMIFGIAPSSASTYNFSSNVPELLRLTKEGTVGIGTDDPATMLDIRSSASGTTDFLTLGLDRNHADTEVGISFKDRNAVVGLQTAARIHSLREGSNGHFSLVFSTSLATDADVVEKFRITSDGKFGFGTNNPQGTVHISSGTSGDATLILEADTDNNNEADNPYILFNQDGGISASAIGHGVDSGLDGNGLTIANSISNGFISFQTGTTNGYTNATERLRITSDGVVKFGGQSYATATSDVTVGNSSSFDISTTGNHVFVKIMIKVGYTGNANYQMHAQYDYATCNFSTSGATATQTEILQVESGNAQFNYSDITVSRPANKTVRVTYAPSSGSGTHHPILYVSGVFNSITVT